ncbi:Glycine cleavage system transcriptional activator [Pigmentiphaga humi]|uniref:Glycine cleavage system transcriptional activator n=1 Tax=Pigmentiphaga humi TaxID=2478468 RepID=A0A3P4AYA3_9BURK|nr:LysR substrate-binding domain-containing protein [Pigmentiphaga humi]VCU68356.1 Glycine cleavage system transcriptional activator [Pigmentiphaga humi]
MNKRILAPLNPLRAFEAAARLGGFTAAGEELSVTQVAISRQVRTLEDYLGVELFVRSARSIKLTKAGARLYPAISRAMDEIAVATAQVSKRGRTEMLAIQAYSTFAQCWLIRRLPDFHDAHPNVEVRLSSPPLDRSAAAEDVDASIHFGVPSGLNLAADFLAPIELMPVMSPALLARHGRNPPDLARLTLLHSLARPRDWSVWLDAAGVRSRDAYKGHRFESSAMAYEAAIQGVGVALGVRVLVESYLESGVLVAPFSYVHKMDGGYYLVREADRPMSRALRQFRQWLLARLA